LRTGILSNLQGEQVGTIIEQDDGTLTGTGKGESLVEQAPGKTFDDWISTLHHSTYLRMVEGTSGSASA
jgi:hypothetical protein